MDDSASAFILRKTQIFILPTLGRQDKHCFFRADVPLLKADKPIQANTYVFPITIPLPKSLPRSRIYEDSQGSFRIEYTLKLKTQARGKFPNKRCFEVASSSRIGESVPCLLQPKPTIPEALGLEAKGKIFLGAHVKDTNVLRGRDLQFSLACRNESTLKIERAVVALEEEYYYTTKSFGGHGTSKIFEKSDIKRLPGIRVVGLHSSEVDSKTTDEETIARRMFKDLKTRGNVISVKVPESSKESYSGIILQISHYLRFTLITKTEEEAYPSIRIPVHIGSERPGIAENGLEIAADYVSETARIKFPLAKAHPDAIVLGHFAGVLDNEESFSDPIPVPDNAKPSMIFLRQELAATIDDFDYLSEKMKDLDWAIFFASLTAAEFGSIIALVGSEFAQPRVAVLLAQNFGGDFTCAHCAAAIRNVAPVFRSNVVEGLLPFCIDLPVNNHLIRGQLSDFEQIIVALHALNEDDANEEDDLQKERSTSSRRRTTDEAPPEMQIPTDILVGSEDFDNDKPPSDMTLETALRRYDSEEPEKITTDINGPARNRQLSSITPRRLDVLLGVADHPQTFKLISAIKEVVDQGDYNEFCPPIYRLVRKRFSSDQRFLIVPLKHEPTFLREATKVELIEHIGNIFDKFKDEKLYEEQEKTESQCSDAGFELKPRASTKDWHMALKNTHSEWELALTVHTYTSGIQNVAENNSEYGGPSTTDICFFKPKHPGNAILVRIIRQILQKNPETTWSPPIYRAIKKSLDGRRFFVSVGERAWCEATQVERRENVEKYFEMERKQISGKIEQTRRSVARDIPLGEKEGSSHARFPGKEASVNRSDNEHLDHRHQSNNSNDRPSRKSKVRQAQGTRPDDKGGSVHRRMSAKERDKESSEHRRLSLQEGNQSDRSSRMSVSRKSFSETLSPRSTKRRQSRGNDAEASPSLRQPRKNGPTTTNGKQASKHALSNESASREGSEHLLRRSLLKGCDESGHSRSSRSPGKYNSSKVALSPSRHDKANIRALKQDNKGDGVGGSERLSRRSLFSKGDGSGHVRRSKSAGKYNNSEVLSPQSPLENHKSRSRSYLQDQTEPSIQGTRRRKSSISISMKGIEIVGSDSQCDLDNGHDSKGEMALNDANDKSRAGRGPGVFRRFSRKNSIRTIEKRNMRHPRDLDICYGSESHPGTIALVEAVIESMHKIGNKGWNLHVYDAIRSDTQGRRFFVRADRESPWREASAEERVDLTHKLFEAKRKERQRLATAS